MRRFLIDPISQGILKELSNDIDKKLTALPLKQQDTKTFQWQVPPGFNLQVTNTAKDKPEGRISYQVLRQFSIHYPIARACIDYLKTKVSKLKWSIIPEDEDDVIAEGDARTKLLTNFFKHPTGKNSKYRNLINALIEDYLVLGSMALERLRTRGGKFLNELKVVDSSTIKIYVDEYGRIPEPPNYAYAQVINGTKVADLTKDDLIYETRNNRSSTVYGISPIESIIIQAESALKGSLYSLSWFTDGNIPEGFGQVPEDWTPEQIKEFQSYFDTMEAGNFRNRSKIKMVPNGFKYDPIKKPDSVGFERFELWILQLTCTVFGVPPQDIGFTMDVNRSSSETQQEMGEERGLLPLASFVEDLFTDIIQIDFGFNDLRFKFTNMDPVDKKMEAEVDNLRLQSGIVSVDEIRTREGMDPIGLGNYVSGSPQLVERLLEEPEEPEINNAQVVEPEDNSEELKEEPEEGQTEKSIDNKQQEELRLWKKQCLNRQRREKPFKKFVSNVLDDWMLDEISDQLALVKTREQLHQVFEPYFNNNMMVLHQLKNISNAIETISN